MIHNYSIHAGKVLHWDTSDSESLYLKNIQEPKLSKRNDLQESLVKHNLEHSSNLSPLL